MSKKYNRVKIFKLILFMLIIAICIYATIYLFPIIKNIETPEERINLKNKITNSGIQGMATLFLLEISQIFLAILPGEPLEIFAGMCYGAIGGTIFILVSILIISTVIFYLVKKFGKNLVYEFCNKEKIDNIENSKIFNNPRKIEYILLILFLIPGTPKDLLVYIGGLLPIKPLRFILISSFARFPSVISSTIAGASIVDGNIAVGAISYVVTFFITAMILILINIFDKNKEAKEALEAIK